MSEILIYHGKQAGFEPPDKLLREAIETASEKTPSPAFCGGEVAHHSDLEDYRSDFGPDTRGQSVIALCDPADSAPVAPGDVSAETVAAIESELRNRLGPGALAVIDIAESYRVDSDGTARVKPKALTKPPQPPTDEQIQALIEQAQQSQD
uniref:Uncharacterized protein n=1 Tax=uncultured virus TaxID=340016 RepID=D5L2J9_9VIRU|nr:hypothetical protein [uncultured virus]